MNTKFVAGIPRAKQVGLEHAKKNLRRCELWLEDPPPLGMSMLRDSMVFFWKASLNHLLTKVFVEQLWLDRVGEQLHVHSPKLFHVCIVMVQ